MMRHIRTMWRLLWKQIGSGVKTISLCMFVVVVGISLLSYHPTDSSWLYARTHHVPIYNYAGLLGAYLASILFFLSGIAVWIMFFFLCYYVWFRLTAQSLATEWDRCVGFACLFISALMFDAMIYHNGGVLGKIVFVQMARVFDSSLIYLFSVVLLFIGLILVTRFSFIFIISAMLSFTHWLVIRLRHRAVFRGVVPGMPRMQLLVQRIVSVCRYPYDTLRYLVGAYLYYPKILTQAHENIVAFEYGNQEGLDELDFTLFSHNERVHDPVHERVAPLPRTDPEPDELSTTYKIPPVSIFSVSHERPVVHQQQADKERAQVVEEKLKRFGVHGTVVAIRPGPVVTLYEYHPHIDTKISKIVALEDDLTLALQAHSVRTIAPIAGTSRVGFEVANQDRRTVQFSSIISSPAGKQSGAELPLILGEDTVGDPVIIDLVKMPHLLLAGSTGSGKSMQLNVMLASLLCKRTPTQVRLILIDPKRLEFSCYADIPHLLFPIISHARTAVNALNWVLTTMDERYEKMALAGARSLSEYNNLQSDESEKFSYIVVVIDELADLMMTAGKEIEFLIVRIAQMARASGIHLIVATQRPSVDVITGLIKVNFPSRISFRVASKVDSRTVLDAGGADKLLGRGDMLFLDAQSAALKRVHGAFIAQDDIQSLVTYVRSQQSVSYLVLEEPSDEQSAVAEEDKELFQQVIRFLDTIDEVSISLLQRRFRIGYNRSARIIDQLEDQGYIISIDGGKVRKVVHKNFSS